MARRDCYLCGYRDFETVAEINARPEGETDFGIPAGQYRRLICKCKNCSVYINVHGLLSKNFYRGDYNQATYTEAILQKYLEIRRLPEDRSDNKARAGRVTAFLDQTGKPRKDIHILDVGSGLCVFAAEMMERGFRCSCIDPDPAAIEHAIHNVHVWSAHAGTLDDFAPANTFDMVTFNKVIEHVERPVEMLMSARKLLAPNGHIYVELPDGDAALQNGSAVDREEFYIEHFTIYNPDAVAYLAGAAGLGIVDIQSLHEPSDKYTIYAFLGAWQVKPTSKAMS